jgi:hypothetical protein
MNPNERTSTNPAIAAAADAAGEVVGMVEAVDAAFRHEPNCGTRFATAGECTRGVLASEQTYYCPECGVMEGNWHMPTCKSRGLVQRSSGVGGTDGR